MIKQFLTLLLYSSLAVVCIAEENLETNLIFELEQDMKLFSNIATDTNQNVDYMPYVISILDSNDLEIIGVHNLREAISLIPGVDLNVGMAGVKNPIFRGSNPYAFGQSRLLIDGVVVNDQLFGGYNQYLDMPIDIIHRIEVVRGPGSMLSHVNSYAGSINVITKANRDDGIQSPDSAFISLGSNKFATTGFIKTVNFAGGKLSTDLYYQEHDLHLPVGDDRIALPPSSGNSDQSLKNYQIGINFDNKDGFQVKGRLSKNKGGVSYGQAFSITDDSSDFLDVTNNSLEIKYTKKLSNDNFVEFALDYLDEIRQLQNKAMPDGSMMGALPNGRYLLVDYIEETFGQRIQFNINNFKTHKIKIGFQSKQSKIVNNDYSISDDKLVTFTNKKLLSNSVRENNTLYFEDLYTSSEKTTIQIGAKYSQFNDVSDQQAIRLALVYRYDDENIYKAMFSQAYREPSWREQYLQAPAFFKPNINVETEKVDAIEFAYIRRISNNDFFKANTFILKNNDQIDAQNTSNTFSNSNENELYGLELEYESSFLTNDVFSANYSYIDGDNVSGALANSASSLLKLYYSHKPSKAWNISVLLKHVTEKKRVNIDTRKSVPSFTLVDLSANYQQSKKSIKYSLVLKNIFDEKYFLPSPNGTYPEDFEQPGQSWLFKVSREF